MLGPELEAIERLEGLRFCVRAEIRRVSEAYGGAKVCLLIGVAEIGFAVPSGCRWRNGRSEAGEAASGPQESPRTSFLVCARNRLRVVKVAAHF